MTDRFDKIKNSKYGKHMLPLLIIVVFAVATNIEEIINDTIVSSFDGLRFIYPLKYFAQQAFSGEFPLWNINAVIGQTAIGDAQNSLFYFLTYLAAPLSSADFYNIFYCIHIAIAGITAYLYFYNRYKKISIALCAGFLFMMSSVLGHQIKAHGRVIAIISWFPLGFLFIDKYLEKLKFNWIIILAFVITIQFSIGFVQDCLYSIIVYCIYLYVGIIREKKGIISAVKSIAALGIICFGMMAVMLIPLYELMKSTGRGIQNFYFFIGGSIFPLEILNTIVPQLFVTGYESTAVYIGALPLILALYSFIYYRKDKVVKLFFFMTLIAYCFCGIGYVPIIRKILFQIPIINSFRTPSRALYVYAFGFLGLSIYGITKINNKEELKKLIKVGLGVFITIIIVAVFSAISKVPYISSMQMDTNAYKFLTSPRAFEYFYGAFLAFGIAILLMLGLYFLKKKYNDKFKILPVLCCIVVLFSMFDLGRYSISNNIYTSTEANDQIQEQEVFDKIKEYSDTEVTRILWGTEYHGYIDTGMNFLDDVKAMNYYGAFDNRDFSMMLGEPHFVNQCARDLSVYHNDLISMLAVRTIVTDKELPVINSVELTQKVLLDKPKVKVEIKDDDFVNIFVEPLYVDDDNDTKNYKLDTDGKSMYMISFDVDYDDVKNLDGFSIGLKNSKGQTLFTPDSGFFFEKDKNTYVVFNYPLENYNIKDKRHKLQIYAANKTDTSFEIRNLKVTQIDIVETDEVLYELKDFADDQYYIYENLNAKDLLYLSDSVKNVENIEDVYSIFNGQLDEVSYVEDYEDMTFSDGQLSSVVVNDNWVSAKVSSKDGAFLNHAQSYYPGWNAYIDGKKTKIYKVNGIIQGIYIPEGEHEILFKYEPKSLKIGAVITIITVILCIVYFIIDRKKSKKSNIRD